MSIYPPRMISVTILTKNAARTLRNTLESLCDFPEVLVYDTGSTDDTISIAKSFPNVSVHLGSFRGFGPTHNDASMLARHDWIFSIDGDEVVSPELSCEILSLAKDPDTIYLIERENHLYGKQLKCCAGWYPDWVVRLYNRKSTQFSSHQVHERILTEGLQLKPLSKKLFHTPYLEVSDLLDKMQRYSSLYAKQNLEKKRASFFKALLCGWVCFCKNYFLKRGFLGGSKGLMISLYNAHTTYYKYLKIWEQSQLPCTKNPTHNSSSPFCKSKKI